MATGGKSLQFKGGHLVTITSQEEQNIVNDIISNFPDNYTWVGATDVLSEGEWRWITGEKFDYSNWGGNQPDNSGNNENYMHLYEEGSWNDIIESGGDFKFGFICEYEQINETKYTPVKTVEYNDNKYEFYNNCISWELAKKICEQKGGHLVTIQNLSENNMIHDNINTLGLPEYWIGLADREKEGKYTWTNNESVLYLNWEKNQPDNDKGIENYCNIYSSSGKWNDLPNYAPTILKNCGFICEYDDKTNADNYKAIKTITFNNSTYEFFENAVTWEKAEEICKLKGGNLVTITSNLENILIQEAAKELSLDYIWLGSTDYFEESIWKWNTQEEFIYTNWANNQPDNIGNNENYLEMVINSGEWNDINNLGRVDETNVGFVCEYDNNLINNSLGDIDNDGKIRVTDATVIQKYLSDQIELSDGQIRLADVNKDGAVTVTDATLIQKYIADLVGGSRLKN